ncbi:MAG: hypothetical protein U1E17_09105 [Geminicoccaceae bacterium]
MPTALRWSSSLALLDRGSCCGLLLALLLGWRMRRQPSRPLWRCRS